MAKVHSQHFLAHLGGSLPAAGRLKYGLSDGGRPRHAAMGKHLEGVLCLLIRANRDRVSHAPNVRQSVLHCNCRAGVVSEFEFTAERAKERAKGIEPS